MRLAHVADVHLGHRQYDHPQRERDVERTFQSVLGEVRERDVAAIVLPGDLFDSRDVTPRTLQRAEAVLEDVDVPVIVSPGNHDQNMGSRRDLTWLQYLNDAGLLTLVAADLDGDRAGFEPTDTADQRPGGGGYVDLDRGGETVRCFGLQYRGAYVEYDLPKVAAGIRAVNEREGDPDATVLLAHFGVDDAVPDLGANVSRAQLTEVEDAVDYLALGHIHKRYETGAVGRNPGSPEALDVQEGRWEDAHGYYVLDTETGSAEHHRSKRRPYYTLDFDVTGYRTFEDLRADFEETVAEGRERVEAVCDRDIHRGGDGDRRAPIVNVRLDGTLRLDHATFDVETLCGIVEEEFDALHVQPTDRTERQAIQELLGDLDREEAFDADGTVNTDALQERVFTTIAEESRYSAEAETVAATLDSLEGLVNEDDEGVADIATYLRDRRRELFPDGPADEDARDVADAGGDETGAGGDGDAADGDTAAGEPPAEQRTLDAEVTSE